MKIEFLKIKEWFLDKIQDTAKRYNTYIDLSRNDDHTVDREDGCVFPTIVERLGESEKAIKVRLSTGSIVGSYKGWVTWIPKSVIMDTIMIDTSKEVC